MDIILLEVLKVVVCLAILAAVINYVLNLAGGDTPMAALERKRLLRHLNIKG